MADTIELPRALEDADTIPLPAISEADTIPMPVIVLRPPSPLAPLPPSSRPHHRECARDREHRGSCFDITGARRDGY